MNVASQAAEDWPNVLDVFGELITHRASGNAGSSTPLQAIVNRKETRDDDRRGTGELQSIEITLTVGEVALTDKDSWVIAGTEYFTNQIHLPSGGRQAVDAVNRNAKSITSPNRSTRDF